MASLAPDLLTNEQAARYLGVSPRSLDTSRAPSYNFRARRIPFVRVDGKVCYDVRDLEAWARYKAGREEEALALYSRQVSTTVGEVEPWLLDDGVAHVDASFFVHGAW